MTVLRTVDEVVSAVGGTASAATLAGVSYSAVCNWLARGKIPPGMCLIFSRALANENKEADPKVFGLLTEARA